MTDDKKTRYARLVEHIFSQKHKPGATKVNFERSDLEKAARHLKIKLPKNLGDVIYSFKFRVPMPESIAATADEGKQWVIKSAGRAKYVFEQVTIARIIPDEMLPTIKIPEATPNIVEKYSFGDEQALLAKIRYNRLLDIFTGVACYSLQNHLRTSVPEIGQIEVDEVYVGVDKQGKQFIFPVEAKGSGETIGVVQIEQDIELCRHRYPKLICRPIAAQLMSDKKIALFELSMQDMEIKKVAERHYELASSEDITDEEIIRYNQFA